MPVMVNAFVFSCQIKKLFLLAFLGIWGVGDNSFVAKLIRQRLLSIAYKLLINPTSSSSADQSSAENAEKKASGKLEEELSQAVDSVSADLLLECLHKKSLDNMSAILVLFLENCTAAEDHQQKDNEDVSEGTPKNPSGRLENYLREYYRRHGDELVEEQLADLAEHQHDQEQKE